MKSGGAYENGREDDRCQPETRGADTRYWHEHATASQNGLVAHFSPDGTYVLRECTGDVQAADAFTLVAQGEPQLPTDLLAELHRLLTARAPCYAAANHEGRKSIVALTRLDIDDVLARQEEEEHLFRRFLETGDFSSY